MKLLILIVFLSLVSLAVLAKDLQTAARKERARRSENAASGRSAPTFTNADLERYGGERTGAAVTIERRESPVRSERDLAKERAHWRKETARHERELARIDARMRRLEWRLAEKRSRRKPGERLSRDPTLSLLEDSLESLREERSRLERKFRERARKAGAFPGWLR